LIEHATANAPTISGDSNAAVAPTDVSNLSPSSTSVAATTGSTQKVVALTFDDGPGPDTQKVATVLEEKKAAGTFFFIGRQIAKYPGIVSGLRAQGFELEDHTWDHANLTKLSTVQMRLEISRTSQALEGAQYLRPPSGSYDATVLAQAHSLGLKLVLWNVDTLDWKYRNAASILAHVRSAVSPGAIILMHR
jgi:peptidoglycan/xylan/chitin deacetylase (PgdA/CDA1 family)